MDDGVTNEIAPKNIMYFLEFFHASVSWLEYGCCAILSKILEL